MEHQSGTYVKIMKESLERKRTYLERLLAITENQSMIAKSEPFDEEAFAGTIEEKDVLINNVNEIDKGFLSVYERVKAELGEDREAYREDLLSMQDLIRKCTDIGLKIEATEERNRAALEQAFTNGRRGVNQAKQSRSVANRYYKSMANGFVNDSMLYDRKK
ncbi:MAG: hypothetical protein K6E30_05520 [Lachnospiraceae bacterium]|nr:hypothetical protein [Lachnospiraceae bacterium]